MKGRFQPTTVGNMMRDENGGYVCYDDYANILAALRRLRNSISDYGGHGNPGCPDRSEAYLAMAEADALLTPNTKLSRAGTEFKQYHDA